MSEVSQTAQLLLRTNYQLMRHLGVAQPDFADTEFHCFSQFGEDGVLLYLFAVLGRTNRKAVEVCAGDGIECNVANLIINHGWRGLLIDGNQQLIEAGRAFYTAHAHTMTAPPTLLVSWITAENIDGLIASNGFLGEIDLMSLDVDGVDYWIWRARCRSFSSTATRGASPPWPPAASAPCR